MKLVMIKHSILGLLLLVILYACTETKSTNIPTTPGNYTSHVNLFIGTDGVGNTHPGAVLPWGMAALSPQTFDFTGMHLATGYRQEHDSIYGFSSINLSGVGCPGAGSIPFKFLSGKFDPEPRGSRFTDEVANPGFYSVKLIDENIEVKTTATLRTGMYQVKLPAGESQVYIDLSAQQGHVKGGEITSHSNKSAAGYQREGFFCGSTNRLKIYFHAELDKEADSSFMVYRNDEKNFDNILIDKPSGIIYAFNDNQEKTINIKLGVSFVSSENAKDNLDSEQTGFQFDKIKEDAQVAWENELRKIDVEGGSEDDKAVFYTALYHSLLMPMTFSDANGDYVKQGSKEILNADGYTRYTAFSLWDTYRTTHPLFSLVYPEKQLDMVKTMVGFAKEADRLPKWEIFGTETNIMIGDPAAIVIGDSYIKGITQFDTETAYNTMVKQATQVEGNYMRRGLQEYLNLGYISMDGPFSDVSNFQWFNGIAWGSTSTTLELNLADYNIAQMAKALGKTSDYEKFMKQSMSFVQLYDKSTGLIRPKNKDGSWLEPFDPAQGLWDKMNFGLRGGPGFCEGSAWQYLFSIPHGMDTLRSIMGEEEFISKLDEVFEAEHFDMTNEPDLAYPFLYNYTAERATKTAQRVHDCLNKYFTNSEDGLPGNDDAGTMSAWVVFAMMGIYPDIPGNPTYQVTTPSFDKITLSLNKDFYSGDKLVIERDGPKAGAIESITFNEKAMDFEVGHKDLTSSNGRLVVKTTVPVN